MVKKIVKLYRSNDLELPVEGSKGSVAKDIRADVLSVKTQHMFGCAKVFIDPSINEVSDSTILYRHEPSTKLYKQAVILFPRSRCLVPSGLHVELPEGISMDVRPRSGISLKFGLMLTNSIGLIDNDYTGDIGVIISNNTDRAVIIPDGCRIAQMKLVRDIPWDWEEVSSKEELHKTARGEGGFNSTGTH